MLKSNVKPLRVHFSPILFNMVKNMKSILLLKTSRAHSNGQKENSAITWCTILTMTHAVLVFGFLDLNLVVFVFTNLTSVKTVFLTIVKCMFYLGVLYIIKKDSSTIMFSFWVLEENNNNNIWSIVYVWSCEFRQGKTVRSSQSGCGSGWPIFFTWIFLFIKKTTCFCHLESHATNYLM